MLARTVLLGGVECIAAEIKGTVRDAGQSDKHSFMGAIRHDGVPGHS